ncbi:MAG TPA: hypothetical protein VLT16_00155 [Candidatus Limnocylindrales bacterium]|nr:hypothetical protein [Candidatus Limnocylindrales bacterium]
MNTTQLQIVARGRQTEPDPDRIYDLDDDLVKFVVYSIVSVRRGHERFMDGGTGQLVVTDRMSGDTFMGWKISEYVQNHGCDPADHQYLRVHYAVVRRWPRQPLRFDERQIEAMQSINDQLQPKELRDENL